MRSPILKQGKILIASVQGSLTDSDLLQLRDELLADVRKHRSTGVIIDVTLLDVMDSFAVRTIRGIAHTIKQLGLRLEGATTALDLEDGLALLQSRDSLGSSADVG